MLTLLLFFLYIQVSMAVDTYIYVYNGGKFGEWSSTRVCSAGSKVIGFRMKVEYYHPFDSTGVNMIELFCAKLPSEDVVTVISSGNGDFGKVGKEFKCTKGSYIKSFSLRVGHHLWDFLGVTNIRVKCSDGTILEGDGYDVGDWGEWSDGCVTEVKGFATKDQEYQGSAIDDSSVNDMRMLCEIL